MGIARKWIYAFILCALGILSCGKSGPPEPPGGVQEFYWTWTRAELLNQCLTIQGGLEGNMDNLYEVVLELQPSDNEDFCAGCPFLPVERETYSRRAAAFKIERQADTAAGELQMATIALTYCPDRKASSYQWRLSGINVNQIAPHALTPIQQISDPLGLE